MDDGAVLKEEQAPKPIYEQARKNTRRRGFFFSS